MHLREVWDLASNAKELGRSPAYWIIGRQTSVLDVSAVESCELTPALLAEVQEHLKTLSYRITHGQGSPGFQRNSSTPLQQKLKYELGHIGVGKKNSLTLTAPSP